MLKVKSANDIIPGFTLIAPSIWEYAPRTTHAARLLRKKDIDAPSLIVLCTWTGAQPRYISKYTTEYQKLFPTSRIMVITTTAKDLCFRNSKRKQQRLIPAIERISSYKYLNDDGMSNGILLHAFSEGGSNKAVELAECYYNITAKRLPVSALCMDSTPGHPRYLRLCSALNKSLPQVPVLRHTGLLFGSAILGCIWILYAGIKGCDNNVITRTRRRLQDPNNFALDTPRCYLYSDADAMIAWQDIHEHAEESLKRGTPVTNVMFEGSGHVEHAKMSPERYWDAVMATWDSAMNDGEKGAMKIDVIIDTMELADALNVTLMAENTLWGYADSQRTLLPELHSKQYRAC